MDGKSPPAAALPRRHYRLAYVLGFFALFMTGYGIWVGIERAALFTTGEQAEGIVLRFEVRRSQKGRLHHHPIIRYADAAGRAIEFRGAWGVDTEEYRPGATVTVFYSPAWPERAMLDDSSAWGDPIIGIGGGAIWLGFFLLARRQARTETMPPPAR